MVFWWIFDASGEHLTNFFGVVLIRRSSQKLTNGQNILMSAELLDHTQYITCYIMCEGVGRRQ